MTQLSTRQFPLPLLFTLSRSGSHRLRERPVEISPPSLCLFLIAGRGGGGGVRFHTPSYEKGYSRLGRLKPTNPNTQYAVFCKHYLVSSTLLFKLSRSGLRDCSFTFCIWIYTKVLSRSRFLCLFLQYSLYFIVVHFNRYSSLKAATGALL
jgi:hypothetical protein